MGGGWRGRAGPFMIKVGGAPHPPELFWGAVNQREDGLGSLSALCAPKHNITSGFHVDGC